MSYFSDVRETVWRWFSSSPGGIVACLPLCLAVPAVALAQQSAPETVTVVASDYKFKPKQLAFAIGVAYRLHVENHGKETHEFTAPKFFKTVQITDAAGLNTDHTEIVVNPGEAKDITFIAQKPGSYRLICADHDWAGMKGNITVK